MSDSSLLDPLSDKRFNLQEWISEPIPVANRIQILTSVIPADVGERDAYWDEQGKKIMELL